MRSPTESEKREKVGGFRGEKPNGMLEMGEKLGGLEGGNPMGSQE